MAVAAFLFPLSGSAHAAWVWVYEGEKHVIVPPEEGQPAWASYPDADGDGKPDPIITSVELRAENDQGEAIGKTRVGQTIYLVAVPELGGLEMETLTVKFRLLGPGGDVALELDDAIREPTPVGTAPAVYRAEYTIPEEPVADHVGQYEATVEVEVGSARSTPEMTSAVQVRVVGPRETTPERVAREVRTGLTIAGEEISKFGTRVARDFETWLERTKQQPPPGALRVVHERETRGIVDKLAEEPGGPLAADRDALSLDRAAALRSKAPANRTIAVVPYGTATEMQPDGSRPLGYLVMRGLRAPGATAPESPAGPEEPRVYRMMLQADETGEPSVGIVAANGTPVVSLPAMAKWLRAMPWPRDSYLKVERQPEAGTDGLISVELVSAVTGGAARVIFTLPVVPTPAGPPGAEPPAAEE